MKCLFFIVLMLSLGVTPGAIASAGHDHDEHDTEALGTHGGRVLEDDDMRLEVLMSEENGEAIFHAWITTQGKPVENAELVLTLTRLDDAPQTLHFQRQGDGWRARDKVAEPHDFDITATLTHQGDTHIWQWDTDEGRVDIDASLAEQSGVTTEPAGAGHIERLAQAYGTLVTPAERIAQLRARFPGMVTEVQTRVGARVSRGDTLAVIESNDSLRRYPLRAPLDGMVQRQAVSVGEMVGDTPLFTLVNNERLWAELKIFPRQRGDVSAGQAVQLRAGEHTYAGRIDHILPTGAAYVVARVVLDNTDGHFAPGDMVNAEILLEKVTVPLVVDNRALQRVGERPGVFIRVGERYAFRPLILGRSDSRHTEVLGGLREGSEVVVGNSYLIKADLEKAGAGHEH